MSRVPEIVSRVVYNQWNNILAYLIIQSSYVSFLLTLGSFRFIPIFEAVYFRRATFSISVPLPLPTPLLATQRSSLLLVAAAFLLSTLAA